MAKPIKLVIVESLSQPGFLSIRMAEGNGTLSSLAFKAALTVSGYEAGDEVILAPLRKGPPDQGGL